jgi:acyl-coenzyme A synthetase/AMP-(fatty) acid ligase
LSFDIAALELLLPLLVGGRVVVAEREEASDGQRLSSRVEEVGATVLQGTPATWHLLVAAGFQHPIKALCGGEALPGQLAGQLLPRTRSLWNLYGPTETTIWSSLYQVSEAGEETIPIGRPIGNTQMYVLSGEGHPQPLGVKGQLCIGGAGLTRGYLRDPAQTAQRLLPNPHGRRAGERLYVTGDWARYRHDGQLEFLGRSDHQVKLHGYRIELGDVEAALRRLPSVREAVVMVREDDGGNKRLVAYLLADHQNITARQLRDRLQEQLPAYMIPSNFLFIDHFPLTPSGKVNRQQLPELETLQTSETTGYIAPRNATEAMLAQIWSELLRIDAIGIHDNFFEIGGHSLLAIQVIDRAREAFSMNIPLKSLYEASTVATLAEWINRAHVQEEGKN